MMPQKQVRLTIQGMTCEACVRHVERALREVMGVVQVEVPGWRQGVAYVVAREDVPPRALEEAVAQAGYRAQVVEETSTSAPQRIGAERPTLHRSAEGGQQRPRLMVIGGGAAGFAAAIKGAELGEQVLLVNDGEIGGTCVNVGCVPSKALLHALAHYHRAGEHPFRGIQTVKGALDWPQVVAHKDALVAALRQTKYRDVLARYPNITYLEGRARFVDETQVEVNGQRYTPERVILATGASPWAPPIPGLDEVPYWTSTTAMAARALPRSLVVLGANAVGLEQAQIFARAGVAVTVVERFPRIAPFEDEHISAVLQAVLEEEGIRVITDFRTERVVAQDGQVILYGEDGRMAAGERLLVATGRRPNTQGLGLEAAGVALGERGEVLVDTTLQTTNPAVYAAGDVLGREMFVYVAAYAGGLAAENALTGAKRPYEVSYIPRVIFTDPQVAAAGLTEQQARERGFSVKVSVLALQHVPRALVARDTRGLIKLVADAATDKLLGAHIVAPEAGEMITVAALALKWGQTVAALRETLFPYLTYTEGIKLAALAFEKDVAMLSCCAG